MKRPFFVTMFIVPGVIGLAGCGGSPPPVAQAPPIANSAPAYNNNNAPPVGGQVYQWQDVPVNQRIPISRAVFDQGGYQIFAQSGETIVVPFANQNLYVLKFGQTGGSPYFVNEGNAPVLYLPPGGYLENAAAQGARWYPFSNGFNYTQPVYVSLAPTWADYVGMGWYPGMSYYGGLWGYSYLHPVWMPGFYINIGGRRYSDYGMYRNYYTSNRNYIPNRVVYNNYNTRTTGSFGAGRSSSAFGGTGSFGSSRRSSGFGSASGSTGSFGSRRSTGFGSSSASGGFGGRASGSGSFGSGSSGSSFGGAASSGRSSFGGAGGFSNTPRSSGSSFGGGRSYGGSFGGGRSSGGSSFGGGRSGGSFGGRRR